MATSASGGLCDGRDVISRYSRRSGQVAHPQNGTEVAGNTGGIAMRLWHWFRRRIRCGRWLVRLAGREALARGKAEEAQRYGESL